MSLDGNRCINCGAKMKLVNVTRINTFRSPEASQYDVSVSHRKAGGLIQSSSRELLCTCCGYRIPAEMAKAVKVKKAKKQKAQKETTTKSAEKKKNNTAFWVKLFIFLVIVALGAYFIYTYRETIMGYWDKLMGIVDKVKGIVDKIASKF